MEGLFDSICATMQPVDNIFSALLASLRNFIGNASQSTGLLHHASAAQVIASLETSLCAGNYVVIGKTEKITKACVVDDLIFQSPVLRL